MNPNLNKPDPVDDLFRRELEDHEVTPSPEHRAAFLEEAGRYAAKRNSWSRWIMGSLLLILVASVSMILLLPTEKKTTLSRQPVKDPGKSSVHVSSSKPEPVLPAQIRSNAAATPATHPDGTGLMAGLVPATPVHAKNLNSQKQTVTTQQTSNETNLITPPVQPPVADISSRTASTDSVSQEKSFSEKETEIPPDQLTSGGKPLPPPEQNPPASDSAHEKHVKQAKPWSVDAGIQYSPEWMFETVAGTNFQNNFGIECNFHLGPWSIRTGAGLSIAKGSNEILVETNPYLGSYQALDSIVFTWDDTYHLIPTFYYTGQEVFDTTLNYTYSFIVKRYTYLQVPLVLGYDFFQKKRFSLGIRAGTVMSFLLKTEALTETYDAGKDKILTINNVTPDRIQFNWQAIGGMNVSYRPSQRFKVELEPEIRYYFNSVYEQADISKKPWSAGFRAALLIDL
jgi:hypothetical protein